MSEWFEDWFDEDYIVLYAHRDATEATQAVATALRAAPSLASGPVLDLGCGSGRHLMELRQTNPEAFGLDLSPALLRRSPEALRGHLLRGDMRRLPLKEGRLSGVCMWFTPFGYFDDGANRQLMSNICRLLRPGGTLLLDFMNARMVRDQLVPEDVVERGGLRVRSRRSIEGACVVKRMRIERLATGETREVTESVRIYEPDELIEMASECGLTAFRALGDYAGSPFCDRVSARWIGLFHL